MAFALWFSVRAEEMLWRFPSFRAKRWLHVLPLLACWLSFEQLHEYWGLAFPWLHLGNAFNGMPYLVQWYQFVGNSGGTLWVLEGHDDSEYKGVAKFNCLIAVSVPGFLS